MPWWGSGGAGSIMAAKSRDKRRKRAPNGRAVKRKSAVRAKRKVQKRAPASGVVEAALAAFAHEVRTPLTGILAISDLLATSELGERERRWADTIKAGAEHLASLANLFVDAAKSRDTSRRIGRGGSNGLRQDLFNLRALARGAGESDRQCGEIHRNRRRGAGGDAGEGAWRKEERRQDQRRLCGFGQRHRPDTPGDQAPVPPVLASQCLDRGALWRCRPRPVVGQADRAHDGRRYRGDAAA